MDFSPLVKLFFFWLHQEIAKNKTGSKSNYISVSVSVNRTLASMIKKFYLLLDFSLNPAITLIVKNGVTIADFDSNVWSTCLHYVYYFTFMNILDSRYEFYVATIKFILTSRYLRSVRQLRSGIYLQKCQYISTTY